MITEAELNQEIIRLERDSAQIAAELDAFFRIEPRVSVERSYEMIASLHEREKIIQVQINALEWVKGKRDLLGKYF